MASPLAQIQWYTSFPPSPAGCNAAAERRAAKIIGIAGGECFVGLFDRRCLRLDGKLSVLDEICRDFAGCEKSTPSPFASSFPALGQRACAPCILACACVSHVLRTNPCASVAIGPPMFLPPAMGKMLTRPESMMRSSTYQTVNVTPFSADHFHLLLGCCLFSLGQLGQPSGGG